MKHKAALFLLTVLPMITLGEGIKKPTKDVRKRIYVLDVETFAESNKSYVCSHERKPRRSLHSNVLVRHGDSVVRLIGSQIDESKFCVVPRKVFETNSKGGFNLIIKSYFFALEEVYNDHLAVGVNLSQNGPQYIEEELQVLKKIVARGLFVTVSAGNERIELSAKECNQYPSCLKVRHFKYDSNFIIVHAKQLRQTNLVLGFQYVTEDGSEGLYGLRGTSQAAARHVGRLFSVEEGKQRNSVLGRSRHPSDRKCVTGSQSP